MSLERGSQDGGGGDEGIRLDNGAIDIFVNQWEVMAVLGEKEEKKEGREVGEGVRGRGEGRTGVVGGK